MKLRFRCDLLVCLLAGLLFNHAYSQQTFNIYNRANGNVKQLNVNSDFSIRTSSSKDQQVRIINSNDTSLSIVRNVMVKHSIKEIRTKEGSPGADTVYFYRSGTDTIWLAHRKILALRKKWFVRKPWHETFAYTTILGATGVIIVPIVWATEGAEAGKPAVILLGGILVTSVSAIFILTRESKFDMVTKWSFSKSF